MMPVERQPDTAMPDRSTFVPPDNPFATRWVRPGAIPFLFADGESMERLTSRLSRQNGWGQITGPHGAGKSSLLTALRSYLEASERPIVFVSLHDGQRRLPAALRDRSAWTPRHLIVVDGYEQLGPLARFRLKRRCRSSQCGLVVTAHRDVGLPPLANLQPQLSTMLRVVEHLTAGLPAVAEPGDIRLCFERRGRNIRDALFDLYDLYERRRR